ncbi:MAG TPA: cytochrome c oxidase subunit II [Steroidobacteraceae bacterium]|nr:cytochrome c oxidase subunit II [Steroidobacteraceae bacterium]
MRLSLPQAADSAPEVDHLLWALLAISAAVLALVFFLLFLYVVRYRATSGLDRGEVNEKTWRLEAAWTGATLAVFFGLFVWGADLYLRLSQAPPDALKIYVIAKQWMWKVEHDGGQREINALHVPVGTPIELVMTSEDVIHDLSIPAFRIKHDVLPDRYESLWFKAREPGTYHLFCTQFCGLDHSRMTGEVVVLKPPEYARWLAQNGAAGGLEEQGRALFVHFGCGGCHGVTPGTESTVRAPPLAGLYGSPVPLTDGTLVRADERYLHDSIVAPEREVVAGYAPIMPSYAGQIGEEDILKLVSYIETLSPERPP